MAIVWLELKSAISCVSEYRTFLRHKKATQTHYGSYRSERGAKVVTNNDRGPDKHQLKLRPKALLHQGSKGSQLGFETALPHSDTSSITLLTRFFWHFYYHDWFFGALSESEF
jgi:hypothetical protein